MDRFIKSTTGLLIAANLLMFIALRIGVAIGGNGLIDFVGLRWPMPWVWTPLTYMFTQGSAVELLFNMLWLWCFSRLFLIAGTERRMLVAYIAGGLGGALLFMGANAVGLASGGVLLGASASVVSMAVCGAVLAPSTGVDLLLIGRVSLRTIAIITVILSLTPFLENNPGGAWAHIGGAMGGFLSGYAMRRYGWIPRFSRKSIIRQEQAMTLDSLLDKVRRSGYQSLTKAERRRLLELSNKL